MRRTRDFTLGVLRVSHCPIKRRFGQNFHLKPPAVAFKKFFGKKKERVVGKKQAEEGNKENVE